MAKILIQGEKNFSSQFEKLLEKRESIDLNIDKVVDNIIKQIKKIFCASQHPKLCLSDYPNLGHDHLETR